MHAAGDAVGQQGPGELAGLGVEDQHDRLVDGTQRVRGLVQAAARDERAVGRDGQPSHPAEVDLLAAS